MVSGSSSARTSTHFPRSSRLPRTMALLSASESTTWRRKRVFLRVRCPARQWRVTSSTASSMHSTSLGRRSVTSVAACPASGAGERRTQSRSGDGIATDWLEAGEGLLGRFGDGEESVELGQLEERPKILVEPRKSKLASRLPHPLGDGYQRAEAGRVDVSSA